MKAADETYVVGWLASQTDMLAEDWEIVNPEYPKHFLKIFFFVYIKKNILS